MSIIVCLALIVEPGSIVWTALSSNLTGMQNPSSFELTLVAIATLMAFFLLRRDRQQLEDADASSRTTPASNEQQPPSKRAA